MGLPWVRGYVARKGWFRFKKGVHLVKVLFYSGKEYPDLDTYGRLPSWEMNNIYTEIRNVMKEFNNLNLGIEFKVLSYYFSYEEAVPDYGCSYIVYYWEPGFTGRAKPYPLDRFIIELGLFEGMSRDTVNRVVWHELKHALGFAHKYQENHNLLYTPILRGWKVDREPNEDTVQTFKTVYDVDSKYKIKGNVLGGYHFGEVYVRKHHWRKRKRLWLYQTTIDINGDFELRPDKLPRKFWLYVCDKYVNQEYGSSTICYRKLGKFRRKDLEEAGGMLVWKDIEFDREAIDWEDMEKD